VRIVAFRLVLARPFHVLHRMDQVAVGNHRVVGGFFKFAGAVVLGGSALVLRGMLKKLGGLQMMIDAFLRHVARIAKALPDRP
jgi:hypothetical protein